MKIIFVTREGHNLAGGRIRSYSFARELYGRGIETKVLSYADDLGAKDGIHEASMGFWEKIRHNISAYKKLSEERNAIIVLQRVNYHSFGPLLSRIIRKNHLVLDIDDWEIREDPRYLWGIYPTSKAEFLTRRIASLSDFCIVSSSYLRDYISKFNKDVYYIPSCVDTDLFNPNSKYTNNGPNPRSGGNNRVKFAWTGTLHRRDDVENIKFIIDCFSELRKRIGGIWLDIVGDGIYCEDALSYIANNKFKADIDFIGWIQPDNMPRYLEGIDIGLFPLTQNTRFNLSKSPTKLLEYMAMAMPTVSSRMGESALIVEDGRDGFLATDKETFIERMEDLAKDIELRRELGKNAREKVLGHYSLKIAGDRLYSIFKHRLYK